MKKIVKLGVAVVICSTVLSAGENQMKLYDVKSGKIDYEIKGSGEIMGQKMQTVGKKRVIFDDYGAKNLTEENKIEKQIIMGQKNVTKTHTLTYLKGAMMYQADFNKKRIIRMENIGMAMAGMMAGNKNMKQAGEKMMKQMGGKKMGTDKVLGYTCDVWDLMGTKQCIYKGVTLRLESNIMGIKNTEVATKAEFDILLSKDDFKLPDFPIYDMEGNKLDRNNIDAMDKRSDKKLSKNAEVYAELGTALASEMQNAGVKQGEQPTKAQEKQMEKGAESAVFTIIKKQILDSKKAVEFAKECYESAGSVKEANRCSHKMDEMMGENSDPSNDLKVWNDKTKKETLGYIDQSLNRMQCIEKASSMKDMDRCMPKE